MDEYTKPARNGHPEFYKFVAMIATLHDRKNYDYAKGGPATGNFDRVSKLMALYPIIDWSQPQMVALVYMLKQLDAFLWMKNDGHESITGEGALERLKDIATYTGIMYCQEKDRLDAERNQYKEPTRVETTPPQCDTIREHGDRHEAVRGAEGKCSDQWDSRTTRGEAGRGGLVGSPAVERSYGSRLGDHPGINPNRGRRSDPDNRT